MALLLASTLTIAGRAVADDAAPTLMPPELLSAPSPRYPEEALAAGVEGSVTLELEIDELGTVTAARVLEDPSEPKAQDERRADPGYGLGAAALAAAAGFRFAPALEDGVPVPAVLTFRVHFTRPAPSGPLDEAATSTAAPRSRLHAEVVDRPGAGEEMSPAFTVVVRGKRPPRSASDWTFELGVTHAAPPPGTSGADLIRKAPGVYISQHGGQGKGHQIFLRGFDAVHGQDVAVAAAGIPVNDVSNVHGQGYVDLNFLIPEVVQRMRLLAGAYDPRQGDFAVAGSLDLELGLARRGLFARTSAGSFGLTRAVVAWGPEDQHEETFLAAEVAKSDGFGPSRAWSRVNVMGQAVLELPHDFDLRLFASSYAGRFDAAGVVRLADHEAGRIDTFGTYDPRQGGTGGRHQALLEVRRETDLESTGFSTFAVLRDFGLRQNFTGFLLDPRGDLTAQRHHALVVGGRAFYARALLPERLRGELGVHWRHDVVRSGQERLRTPDGRPYLVERDDEVRVTDLGLYADANLHLAPGLQLRGGLRLESMAFVIDERLAFAGAGSRRDAFGFHLAPKATLDWLPVEALRLFASYGNGFRSPQAVSLGQGERSPLAVVHSGELGGRLELGPILRATASAFASRVEEDVIFDHASGRNVFAGETLRGGLSALLESQIAAPIHATASVTYTRAIRAETGQVLPFVPPLVLRLDVDVHHHLGEAWGVPLGLFGALGGTALAPRPLPFGETSAAVAVLEAAAGVEWGLAALSLEVYNLLDARWRDSEFVYASSFDPSGGTSRVPARHFTAGAPRMVQLSLSLDL